MKSLLKKLVSILVLLSLCAGVVFSGNIKDAYYRYSVGSAVVRVMNLTETSGGTGFHVETEDGSTYILTNKHVCELADAKGQVLIERDGLKMIRKVVERYGQHDLCLVEPLSENETTIDIASEISKGEDLVVVGHPGLRQLTLSHGEFIGQETIEMADRSIADKEHCEGQWYANPWAPVFGGPVGLCLMPIVADANSAIIYGGNSGSPVINKYGNVVGVVFAGSSQQATDGYMVPLRHIQAFLSLK